MESVRADIFTWLRKTVQKEILTEVTRGRAILERLLDIATFLVFDGDSIPIAELHKCIFLGTDYSSLQQHYLQPFDKSQREVNGGQNNERTSSLSVMGESK